MRSSNPQTLRFEHTDANLKDWERQYAAGAEVLVVASKLCVKLAQDAVAVRASAFYAVPLGERAAF